MISEVTRRVSFRLAWNRPESIFCRRSTALRLMRRGATVQKHLCKEYPCTSFLLNTSSRTSWRPGGRKTLWTFQPFVKRYKRRQPKTVTESSKCTAIPTLVAQRTRDKYGPPGGSNSRSKNRSNSNSPTQRKER